MRAELVSSVLLMAVCCVPDVHSVKPSLENTVVNYTVIEGRTAILPCTVSNLGKHKVAWVDQWTTVLTFNNMTVIDDERIRVSRPTDESWNLQFDKVKYGDQGLYTCQINTTPPLLQPVMLSVVVPPRISSSEDDEIVTVREGEKATLTCNATGIPRPTVTWYRQSIARGEPRERVGYTGEVLVIHNITRFCGGKYECEADNGIASKAQRTTLVRVKFHPQVTLANKRMGQSIGKDTILECVVSGYPQAEAAWKFQGRQLSNSGKYKLDIYNHQDDDSKITLSLNIKNIQPQDYGQYTCMASNDMGKARQRMTLYEHKERTRATPPTTQTITTTTTSSTSVSHVHIARTFQPGGKLDTQNLAHMPKGRAGVGHGRHEIINTDRQDDRYIPQQSKSEASLQSDANNSAPDLLRYLAHSHLLYCTVFNILLNLSQL